MIAILQDQLNRADYIENERKRTRDEYTKPSSSPGAGIRRAHLPDGNEMRLFNGLGIATEAGVPVNQHLNAFGFGPEKTAAAGLQEAMPDSELTGCSRIIARSADWKEEMRTPPTPATVYALGGPRQQDELPRSALLSAEQQRHGLSTW